MTTDSFVAKIKRFLCIFCLVLTQIGGPIVARRSLRGGVKSPEITVFLAAATPTGPV